MMKIMSNLENMSTLVEIGILHCTTRVSSSQNVDLTMIYCLNKLILVSMEYTFSTPIICEITQPGTFCEFPMSENVSLN